MKKKLLFLGFALVMAFCLVCNIYLLAWGRGKDGLSAQWYFGSGVPAADLGQPGDCYLDLDANAVYQRTSDEWKRQGEFSEQGSSGETVEVTLDAGEGTLPAGSEKLSVKKGGSVELPLPVRDGYLFLGWFVGDGVFAAQVNALTVFTSDVTLTAHWQKKHVITLDDTNTRVRINENVTLRGRYDGTPDTEIAVFIEKGSERLTLAEAKGKWVGNSGFTKNRDGNGSFSGFIPFLEEGEYNIILTAEEDGFVAETTLSVQVVSDEA